VNTQSLNVKEAKKKNDKASCCYWSAYQEKRLGEMGLGKMRQHHLSYIPVQFNMKTKKTLSSVVILRKNVNRACTPKVKVYDVEQ